VHIYGRMRRLFSLKLRVEAHSGYRYGPAVPAIGRVFDELIIKAYVGLPQNRDVIVGLDDLFRSRMGS